MTLQHSLFCKEGLKSPDRNSLLFVFFEPRFLDQLPIILAYGFGIDKAKHWILPTLRSTVTRQNVVLRNVDPHGVRTVHDDRVQNLLPCDLPFPGKKPIDENDRRIRMGCFVKESKDAAVPAAKLSRFFDLIAMDGFHRDADFLCFFNPPAEKTQCVSASAKPVCRLAPVSRYG